MDLIMQGDALAKPPAQGTAGSTRHPHVRTSIGLPWGLSIHRPRTTGHRCRGYVEIHHQGSVATRGWTNWRRPTYPALQRRTPPVTWLRGCAVSLGLVSLFGGLVATAILVYGAHNLFGNIQDDATDDSQPTMIYWKVKGTSQYDNATWSRGGEEPDTSVSVEDDDLDTKLVSDGPL
ncbi:hypothetical protein MTO96_034984 [Rhipicephalus appendiculatus]